MHQELSLLPNEIYSVRLQTINHINFSRREVDILASLLSGKETKEIAVFLSIAPRTVDNVLYNISKTINAKNRQEIIEFIKRSYELSYIQEYYKSLSLLDLFEKQLRQISKTLENASSFCLIMYEHKDDNIPSFIELLKKHLELIGIKPSITALREKEELLNCFKSQLKEHHIFLLSEDQLKKNLENKDFEKLIKDESQLQEKLIFLMPNFEKSISNSSSFQTDSPINIINSSNYYSCILDILSQLFPGHDFCTLRNKLKELYIHESTPLLNAGTFLNRSWSRLKIKLSKLIVNIYQSSKVSSPIAIGSSLCILLVALFSLNSQKEESSLIRYDFTVPINDTLLKRSSLMKQLDKAFKNQKSIQTVTLVGIGGAGKTTLARTYAREQKAPVVWEINSESKLSLLQSFENLAFRLAKTTHDKEALKTIQNIKDSKVKEENLLLFVKNKLRNHTGWFLLYDNVDRFNDLQKCFPSDSQAWGSGKVIITTRDSNVANNGQINYTILIGELSSKDKLKLFMGIMDPEKHSLVNEEQTKKFLEYIPSFPLDVSTAAYYVKRTNTSYESYLQNLKRQDEDFEKVQKDILSDLGNYAKTRFNIISMCLDLLIKEHPDFKYLLLYVCLLDSQNIPRLYLDFYKKNTTVDSFIYNLNKFSIITINSFSTSHPSTFSIHRSTQEICLAYLMKNSFLNDRELELITQAFQASITYSLDKEDLSIIKLSELQSEVFINHRNISMRDIKALVIGELGRIYLFQGNFNKAKECLEESLPRLRELDMKEDVARVLEYTGVLYKDLGEFKKSKAFFEESLSIYNTNFFKYRYKIARVLSFLGDLHKDIGDYETSKTLFKRSIAIYQTSENENSAAYAKTLTFLGLLYKDLNQHEKANIFVQKGYEKFKAISNNHTGVAMTLAYLGNINSELGNYEKAQKFLEQSLVVYKQHFSEGHVAIARALSYLGDLHRKLGNYKKAQPLLENSLTILKKQLHETHPHVVWAARRLGILYQTMGQYEKAEHLFKNILKVNEKAYGLSHIKIASLLKDMGIFYMQVNNLNMAETYLIRSLNIFLSNKHYESYEVLESLINIYLSKSEKQTTVTRSLPNLDKDKLNYLNNALKNVRNSFPIDSRILKIQSILKKIAEM